MFKESLLALQKGLVLDSNNAKQVKEKTDTELCLRKVELAKNLLEKEVGCQRRPFGFREGGERGWTCMRGVPLFRSIPVVIDDGFLNREAFSFIDRTIQGVNPKTTNAAERHAVGGGRSVRPYRIRLPSVNSFLRLPLHRLVLEAVSLLLHVDGVNRA